MNSLLPANKMAKLEQDIAPNSSLFTQGATPFNPTRANVFNPNIIPFNPLSNTLQPIPTVEEADEIPLTQIIQTVVKNRPDRYGGGILYNHLPVFAHYENDGKELYFLDCPTSNYVLTSSKYKNVTKSEVLKDFTLMGVGVAYNMNDFEGTNTMFRNSKTFNSSVISYTPNGKTQVRNSWKGTLKVGCYIGYTLEKTNTSEVVYTLAKDNIKKSQTTGDSWQFIPRVSTCLKYYEPLYKEDRVGVKKNTLFIPLAIVKERDGTLSQPNYSNGFPRFGAALIDVWVNMDTSYVSFGSFH